MSAAIAEYRIDGVEQHASAPDQRLATLQLDGDVIRDPSGNAAYAAYPPPKLQLRSDNSEISHSVSMLLGGGTSHERK